jgi:hypothetical protein
MTNTSTKKLTIDNRLFKGLNVSESNSARHTLLDKFYKDQSDVQSDVDGWFTTGTNLGFTTNVNDTYKLYDTLDGSLNYNTQNETYGIYINKLTIDQEYKIYVDSQLYKVKKTSETPNTYQLTNSK